MRRQFPTLSAVIISPIIISLGGLLAFRRRKSILQYWPDRAHGLMFGLRNTFTALVAHGDTLLTSHFIEGLTTFYCPPCLHSTLFTEGPQMNAEEVEES